MIFFALLIGGICILNALKFVKIVDGGLDALHMDSRFQMPFYIYMSTLATIVPPSIVWLVLRRLTDNLRNMAARDPLTDLLNRRGLMETLRSEEHTSEIQSHMRLSYAVFGWKKTIAHNYF